MVLELHQPSFTHRNVLQWTQREAASCGTSGDKHWTYDGRHASDIACFAKVNNWNLKTKNFVALMSSPIRSFQLGVGGDLHLQFFRHEPEVVIFKNVCMLRICLDELGAQLLQLHGLVQRCSTQSAQELIFERNDLHFARLAVC